MRIIAENAKVMIKRQENTGKKKVQLVLDVKGESEREVLQMADYLISARQLNVDVEKHFDSRSLNANAMFWALCQRLAGAVGGSNEETYLRLLEDYGVTHTITVDKRGASMLYSSLIQNYRKVRLLGMVNVDGADCYQFQCYLGSHAYNTKQMGRLLDGVLNECRELGISTFPPSEVEKVKKGWGA